MLTAATAAQQQVSGLVRDARGEPWAGARVILVSRLLPWDDRHGSSDQVETLSDERGRFRMGLLPGRSYSAFAIEGGEQARRVSQIADDVMAGQTLRLTEAAPRPPLTIEVANAEPWRERGELVFRLVTTAKQPWIVPIALDAHDRTVAPIVPGERVWLEAWLGSERPIARQSLVLGRPGKLELPAPLARTLSVVDDAQSQPVAGASVAGEIAGYWHGLGTTDARGLVTIELPAAPRSAEIGRLLVSAPGFGERVAHTQLTPGAIGALTVSLPRAPGVRGRLLLTAGRSAASHLILYYAPATHGRGGWTASPRPRVFTTEADGTFELSVPGSGTQFSTPVQIRVAAMLEPGLAASLAERAGADFPIAGEVVLHPGQTVQAGQGAVELGDLVLAEMHLLQVSIARPDGGAASHAGLTLTHGALPGIAMHRDVSYRATRKGTLGLLLPRGEWLLTAHEPEGFGFVEVGLSATTAQTQAVTLRLERPILISGRVVNRDGRGLAGAQVAWNPDLRRMSPELQRIFAAFQGRSVTTDQSGAFELRVPRGDLGYWLWATVMRQGRRHQTLQNVLVEVEHQDVGIDLEIPDAPETDTAAAPSGSRGSGLPATPPGK